MAQCLRTLAAGSLLMPVACVATKGHLNVSDLGYYLPTTMLMAKLILVA